MDVFYIFETQEVGPALRIPMQFDTPEEAQAWIDRRKELQAFAGVEYKILPDNPQSDAEEVKRFRDV